RQSDADRSAHRRRGDAVAPGPEHRLRVELARTKAAAMALNLSTRIVRRSSGAPVRVEADIAVLGSGAAGMSAARVAGWLGARLGLVGAAPALGRGGVNAIIGPFSGFYTDGPQPYQLTDGIVDAPRHDLGAAGALHARRGRHTTILLYSEVARARWI